MGAAHVGENDFEQEVINSQIPVLVDFWAEWCGPCKMIAPIVDEVADEMKDKVKIVKVNVDEAQSLAMKYGVMSIPTLLVFKGGQIAEQFVGALSKEQLIAKITAHV